MPMHRPQRSPSTRLSLRVVTSSRWSTQARSVPRPMACSRSTTTPRPAGSVRCTRSSRIPTHGGSFLAGTSPRTRRPSISPSPCRVRRWRSATCRSRSGWILAMAARACASNSRRRCPPTCCSSPSATSSARLRWSMAPRSASSPARACCRRPPSRWNRRSRSCASTTTISARRIRCRSSTTSPRRAPANSSARWRTGARSTPSNMDCCSTRRSPPSPTSRTCSRPRRTKWRINGSATW